MVVHLYAGSSEEYSNFDISIRTDYVDFAGGQRRKPHGSLFLDMLHIKKTNWPRLRFRGKSFS